MRMRLRHNILVARRFLSVILTYALVLTGVAGMEAHAHHAGGMHQHNHALADDPSIASDDMAAVDHHTGQHGTVPTKHHCGDCLDFVCHGGLAVLPTIDGLSLTPTSVILIARADFAQIGRCPAPLDRPPLSLRS
jgi:hypothetical protein